MADGRLTRRFFLPHSPDVLGMLQRQADTTVEAMEALVAWTAGEPGAGDHVRDCEHRADKQKRKLRQALTEAFTLPLEPEDIFTLSMDLDEVLGGAKNLVREAEVMSSEPDDPLGEMARALADGVVDIRRAFGALGEKSAGDATRAADRAIKAQRAIEHTYRTAMSALVESGDFRQVAAQRELYRRMARTSDDLVRVAERVWYAVLKLR